MKVTNHEINAIFIVALIGLMAALTASALIKNEEENPAARLEFSGTNFKKLN